MARTEFSHRNGPTLAESRASLFLKSWHDLLDEEFQGMNHVIPRHADVDAETEQVDPDLLIETKFFDHLIWCAEKQAVVQTFWHVVLGIGHGRHIDRLGKAVPHFARRLEKVFEMPPGDHRGLDGTAPVSGIFVDKALA